MQTFTFFRSFWYIPRRRTVRRAELVLRRYKVHHYSLFVPLILLLVVEVSLVALHSLFLFLSPLTLTVECKFIHCLHFSFSFKYSLSPSCISLFQTVSTKRHCHVCKTLVFNIFCLRIKPSLYSQSTEKKAVRSPKNDTAGDAKRN